jgi:hypothetical protein
MLHVYPSVLGRLDNSIFEDTQQMSTKLLSIAAFAAILSLASVDARAAGGCGPGAHRDRFGYCRPNEVVVAPGAVVVPAPVVVEPVVCGPGLRWHPGRRRCWAY